MQYLVLGIFVFASFLVARKTVASWRVPVSVVSLAALLHLFATVVYMSTLEGDWETYFERGKLYAAYGRSFNYLKPGTQFVIAVNHLIQNLDLFSPAIVFLLFSSVGLCGNFFFLRAIANVTCNHGRYWFFLGLLPGMHFWSSAIGKDSLIFFGLNYVFFSITAMKLSVRNISLGVLLVFLIRPHIAFLLVFSFIVGNITTTSSKIHLKLLVLIALCCLVALSLPYIQKFTGVTDISLQAASERIEYAATKNQKGGGAVDLTSYAPHMRLFTYLFRPLFVDAKGITALAASCENAILLLLVAGLFRLQFLKYVMESPRFWKVSLLFFVLSMWVVLGMSTANLGLAMRQKFQFVPCILLLFAGFRACRIGSPKVKVNSLERSVSFCRMSTG